MKVRKKLKVDRIDLTKENDEERESKKHVVTKMEAKPQINVDPTKGLDVHVPVSDVSNLAKMQGLVNIHFHFYGGSK